MYHVGKVLEVWGGKTTKGEDAVQATLEMWDENVITLKADVKVSKQVRNGDFVLVDYTPVMMGASAVPRQMITKVLEAKAGERAWNAYKEFHKKQRSGKSSVQVPVNMPQESYFG